MIWVISACQHAQPTTISDRPVQMAAFQQMDQTVLVSGPKYDCAQTELGMHMDRNVYMTSLFKNQFEHNLVPKMDDHFGLFDRSHLGLKFPWTNSFNHNNISNSPLVHSADQCYLLSCLLKLTLSVAYPIFSSAENQQSHCSCEHRWRTSLSLLHRR